jgi:hypothetical protein
MMADMEIKPIFKVMLALDGSRHYGESRDCCAGPAQEPSSSLFLAQTKFINTKLL